MVSSKASPVTIGCTLEPSTPISSSAELNDVRGEEVRLDCSLRRFTVEKCSSWTRYKPTYDLCISGLSLLQKSRIMTRSGTRYRLPLMTISSTEGFSSALRVASVLITSMLPLLRWPVAETSVGGSLDFGMRRFG